MKRLRDYVRKMVEDSIQSVLLKAKPPIKKEIKYYFNKTEYCSQCDKLRYAGYTIFSDSAMCCCPSMRDNIPSYIDDTKYESYLKENIKYVYGSPNRFDGSDFITTELLNII